MRPDNQRPNTPITIPSRQTVKADGSTSGHHNAAANILRDKIDAIYRDDPNLSTEVPTDQTPTSATTAPKPPNASSRPTITPGPGAVNVTRTQETPTPKTEAATENPYERTHNETAHTVNTDAWKQYHSAWQSYYQQYYERYYIGQVHATRQELERQSNVQERAPVDDSSMSTDEAMYDLRSKLRNEIKTRATKIRKSRHFLPILAACIVMIVFLFLQYNRVVFAAVNAYVTPGNMDPTTLIIDPNSGGAVSSGTRLIIPKINVDVPIIWNANAASEDSLNAAMAKGVAWFNIQGASAKPGEVGNFVLSGHSSNDWLDSGDYKFIFARLDQLKDGDTIYVDYKGTRYVYAVSTKKVVKPTDVAALTGAVSTPEITLVTCTPLGTSTNRLLVFADQVSPDPSSAAKAESTTSTTATAAAMPANSPTFLERLFGGN